MYTARHDRGNNHERAVVVTYARVQHSNAISLYTVMAAAVVVHRSRSGRARVQRRGSS